MSLEGFAAFLVTLYDGIVRRAKKIAAAFGSLSNGPMLTRGDLAPLGADASDYFSKVLPELEGGLDYAAYVRVAFGLSPDISIEQQGEGLAREQAANWLNEFYQEELQIAGARMQYEAQARELLSFMEDGILRSATRLSAPPGPSAPIEEFRDEAGAAALLQEEMWCRSKGQVPAQRVLFAQLQQRRFRSQRLPYAAPEGLGPAQLSARWRALGQACRNWVLHSRTAYERASGCGQQLLKCGHVELTSLMRTKGGGVAPERSEGDLKATLAQLHVGADDASGSGSGSGSPDGAAQGQQGLAVAVPPAYAEHQRVLDPGISDERVAQLWSGADDDTRHHFELLAGVDDPFQAGGTSPTNGRGGLGGFPSSLLFLQGPGQGGGGAPSIPADFGTAQPAAAVGTAAAQDPSTEQGAPAAPSD